MLVVFSQYSYASVKAANALAEEEMLMARDVVDRQACLVSVFVLVFGRGIPGLLLLRLLSNFHVDTSIGSRFLVISLGHSRHSRRA